MVLYVQCFKITTDLLIFALYVCMADNKTYITSIGHGPLRLKMHFCGTHVRNLVCGLFEK